MRIAGVEMHIDRLDVRNPRTGEVDYTIARQPPGPVAAALRG